MTKFKMYSLANMSFPFFPPAHLYAKAIQTCIMTNLQDNKTTLVALNFYI